MATRLKAANFVTKNSSCLTLNECIDASGACCAFVPTVGVSKAKYIPMKNTRKASTGYAFYALRTKS